LTAAPAQTFLCTGRVVREDATPIGHALAFVAWGTAPTPEIAFRADDNGIFRLALPSGRFRIDARGSDGATGSLELIIEREPLHFDIVLKSQGAKPG
jgi:hypothetical protein